MFISRIMDEAAVARSVRRIAHEILEKNGGADSLCLIGIYRRGVPLAERIAWEMRDILGISVPVGRVDIAHYRDDLMKITDAPHATKSAIPFDVAGMRVVLVDDVLYTGRTARAAIDAVFAQGRAAEIQLAALVDRGHRELPIRADYVGKNVPTAQNERITVRIPPFDEETSVSLYSPDGGKDS